ncbi:MAG TPA: ABC transporter permease [Jatrophihabitantaceae bacterium]|jgi:osmoprotectant transport system permease protein|nr:ABC transporter permease [Jatrophihabitantaceae bacterium]
MISQVFTWLNDPAHWRDSPVFTGIPTQLLNHLRYSLVAMAIAVAIALPLGLVIGHTGRGTWAVAGINAVRAIPGVGLLVLLAVVISPHFHGRTDLGYLLPTEIVLVVIAIPPVLANTYAGVQNVDPEVRDAASGMGMTGAQVLRRVELPCSLPLIFSGIRSATLQVIATATIASYLPLLGGLGRFIYDGFHQQDYPQMISGGVLVALLAVIVDLLLAGVQRYAVSPGISGRYSRRTFRSTGPATAAVVQAEVSPA